MKTRIEEYSVGQLARLAGVSVRTLHHYDDIGLLKPAHVGANGYRLYGRIEMLRLQEIMFYRDVGLSLDEVGRLLDGPADAVERLIRHRDRLQEDSLRTARIIDTLNATIAHLKGERDLALNDLYTPFSDDRQAEYEEWLTNEYGPDMAASIATSKAAVEQLPDGMAGAMNRLKNIEIRLVAAYEAGLAPEADDNHPMLEQHRALMTDMWGRDCTADGFAGLADMYTSHPDFVARYERLSPKFSGWLPAAMRAHAVRLRGQG
ncbi:MerR family transcriptional regulator [Anderseniella sp. Alg231-50]|uniref:MerR family transcriptional regulator n=1 Tax=Anderseniella sp. Alg231-50 TaxID=1922226 RepID=UPI000D557105